MTTLEALKKDISGSNNSREITGYSEAKMVYDNLTIQGKQIQTADGRKGFITLERFNDELSKVIITDKDKFFMPEGWRVSAKGFWTNLTGGSKTGTLTLG